MLNSPEKIRSFTALCRDREYSNDYASLVHERTILQDIVDDKNIRTAFLALIYRAKYDIFTTHKKRGYCTGDSGTRGKEAFTFLMTSFLVDKLSVLVLLRLVWRSGAKNHYLAIGNFGRGLI